MFDLKTMPSQKGRLAIVTGANTGLGYETALGLARTGAHVVLACRNMSKAEEAKQHIRQEVTRAKVDVMPLDLGCLVSIRAFVDHFREKHGTLDILVNNAGIMMPPYEKTPDGFESQFGVNYLGHFLLTSLLIDLMPDCPESRIVLLSSLAHQSARIRFDDLQSEKRYIRFEAYAQSKLACLLFGNELARRLERAGRELVSVSAHPGVSITELVRHLPVPKIVFNVANATIAPLFSHPPSEGAKPILYAALAPEVRGGEYYGPTGFREMIGPVGPARMKRNAQDEVVAERLWTISEDLTDCTFDF